MALNWDASKEEYRLAEQIAERAHRLVPDYRIIDAEMDVMAVHLNDTKLRLQDLLEASDFEFAHDVFGIQRHIDRSTGKLQDCFMPRFADVPTDPVWRQKLPKCDSPSERGENE